MAATLCDARYLAQQSHPFSSIDYEDLSRQMIQLRSFSSAPHHRARRRSGGGRMSSSKHRSAAQNGSIVDNNIESFDNSNNSYQVRNNSNKDMIRNIWRLDSSHQSLQLAITQYRDIWYPQEASASSENDLQRDGDTDDNVATHWKQTIQFHHPPVGTRSSEMTLQQLVDSEQSFQVLCDCLQSVLNNTLIFASSQAVRARMADMSSSSSSTKNKDDRVLPKFQNYLDESNELVAELLPFWQNICTERTLLVQHYLPASTNSTEASPTKDDNPRTFLLSQDQTKDDNSQKSSWISGWFSSTSRDTTTDMSEAKEPENSEIQLTAHQSKSCLPNIYFYKRALGHLYYSVPNFYSAYLGLPADLRRTKAAKEKARADDPKELARRQSILEERVVLMSKIAKSMPEEFFREKLVKFILRGMADLGTLEGAQDAERFLQQNVVMPDENSSRDISQSITLLWIVLRAYHLVVSNSRSPKIRLLAMKRIFVLLDKAKSDPIMRTSHKARVSWMTVGLMTLSDFMPSEVPDYFRLTDEIVEYLYKSSSFHEIFVDGKQQHKHDPKILHFLLIVYSRMDGRSERSKILLELLMDNADDSYPNIRTFRSILKTLVADSKNSADTSETESSGPSNNFEYALGVLNRMSSTKNWLPNMETFELLLQLVTTGPEADDILARMERHRSVTSFEKHSIKAYEAALDCWVKSAALGHPNAAERALAILSRLERQSRPLFLSMETHRSELDHIYSINATPTRKVYTAVLEACANTKRPEDKSRALEIAFEVYRRQQNHNIVLSSTMYALLLSCVADFLPDDRSVERIARSIELFESAEAHDRVTKEVLKELNRANPGLYEAMALKFPDLV